MPSTAARIMKSASSTINGPFTSTTLDDLLEDRFLAQRRAETTDELIARCRCGEAARGSVEETNAETIFESSHRMTQF
jgi:hypothetical protein